MFPSESNKVGMDYSYGAPEWEAFKSTLQYEERIVAFLDVMGWAEAIKQSVDDPELTKKLGMGIGYALNHKKAIDFIPFFGAQLTQFSDSIIISVKAEDPFALETFLFGLVKTICNDFMSIGLPVRGAITQGSLIHQDSLVYGPALVKAYQLEQKEALWPRVILDPLLIPSVPIPGRVVTDQEGNVLGLSSKNWRIDHDGWIFLDFLQPLIPKMPVPVGIDDGFHKSQIQIHLFTLTPAKSLIEKGLIENKHNAKVHAKYVWMAHYFNTTISEYPEVGMVPISIS